MPKQVAQNPGQTWHWDWNKKGDGIILSEDCLKCWIKEPGYNYKTVISNKKFN
jgi:hypothetical protein